MAPTRCALLLTDLVDSTRLVETLGDARAAEAFTAHDRVARDLLPQHRGREIDKSDGFLLLFESASDAVGYALAFHRALANLDMPLSARAGLHVGEVTLRENAPGDVARGAKPLEVEGLAKPVAARVMSVATGGQTLMTAEAREALGRTDLRVESHGHWRMKGLAESVELFEVGDGASPWMPPEDTAKAYRVVERDGLWIPRRDVRRSLPAESDAFVGRTEDLDGLARLVHGAARLVTLIGTGGTGKTRLARRFAWTWLGDYPGGAWYCDLSEARSVEEICGAVARALDVPLGKDDPVVQLGHAIAGRGPCLVVLDNFEQVVEHAAATVGRWVERAAEASFVVTSRERLALPSETLFPVQPLPEEPAVRLFEARARAQDPGFVVTKANRADVLAIVKTLDGLPLAIELAAARIRVLPPAALRERLKDRFTVLAGARGAARRQATLRAAIDWSWDLLTPWEQAALAQASVFVGGFTLEEAESVLALSPSSSAPPVMDVVQSLLDKSLLRTWTPTGDRRLAIDEPYFGMYVSIQEYAADKLRTEGALPSGAGGPPAERAAFERHGRYFARHGTEQAVDALDMHGGVARRQALTLELENLVVASRRAVARDEGPTAVATLAAAWIVLALKGPFLVGAELARQVVGLGALEPADRGHAARILAEALRMAGRTEEASRHSQDALAFACEAGDRRNEGHVLGNLGNLHREQGRMEEALRDYQDALAIHREVGARRFEGIVLGNLGNLHFEQGRIEEALRHYQDALAIHREVGDRRFEGIVLGNVGGLHLDQGRVEEALRHYQDALAIAREAGDRRNEGIVLGNLGSLQHEQGRMEEALRHYQDALAIHREVGNRRFQGFVLGNLGRLHREQGRMEEALRHSLDALAIHREVGDRRSEGIVLGELGELHARAGRAGDARSALAEGVRLLRAVGNPLALGELLCTVARLERSEGDLEAATAALAEAESLAAEAAAGAGSVLGEAIARARAELGMGAS